MPTINSRNHLPFIVLCVLLFLSGRPLRAQLVFETGGVKISLGKGWTNVDEPPDEYIQKRAKNSRAGMAFAAGTIHSEFSLEQFIAITAAALVTEHTNAQLDLIATKLKIPRSEIDRVLNSEIGLRKWEEVKRQSPSLKFTILNLDFWEMGDGTRYEIDQRVTDEKKGNGVYTRRFFLEGVKFGEIVTITYAGGDYDIFKNTELADAIQRPPRQVTDAEEDALAYCAQGLNLAAQRDFHGAITNFTKAIKLKPDYAEAFNHRGLAQARLLKEEKDLVPILSDYDKAIELKPDYADSHFNRGIARGAKGDSAGSLSDFDRAIELKPDFAPAYEYRAKTKKARGDVAGAQADSNKATELKSH